MSVTYIEKGIGLWKAIRAAGHDLFSKDGVYTSTNDAAVQAIINSYDALPDQKAVAIVGVKATALAKMQTIFPALADIDTVNLVAELWLSVAPAARSPTANMTKVINVYTAAKNGIANVNAATDKPGVDAAVAAIAWPF
jgi:hypothetical protein